QRFAGVLDFDEIPPLIDRAPFIARACRVEYGFLVEAGDQLVVTGAVLHHAIAVRGDGIGIHSSNGPEFGKIVHASSPVEFNSIMCCNSPSPCRWISASGIIFSCL